MISPAKLGNGRQKYYLQQLASDRQAYLSGHGEAPGYTAGQAWNTLGASGEVTAEQFERVFIGGHPDRGAASASSAANHDVETSIGRSQVKMTRCRRIASAPSSRPSASATTLGAGITSAWRISLRSPAVRVRPVALARAYRSRARRESVDCAHERPGSLLRLHEPFHSQRRQRLCWLLGVTRPTPRRFDARTAPHHLA
jgi:TrwC relaxase